MNCLSEIDHQRYIDKEMDDNSLVAISKHLESCEKCMKVYLDILDEIRFVNESLSVLSVDPKDIPPVDQFVSKTKTQKKSVTISMFIKLAAAILILGLSFTVVWDYFQKPVIENYNDKIVYDIMEDYDPNEQWHDNQMIVTISNPDNIVELTLIMDNNN